MKWTARAIRGAKARGPLGWLLRGLETLADLRCVERLVESSLAEAACCEALGNPWRAGGLGLGHAIESILEGQHGAEGALAARAVLCALGAGPIPEPPPGAWLECFSRPMRVHRRHLRRLLGRLRDGKPLGELGCDPMGDAGAYLDRLREAGAPGVGWPPAACAARMLREELKASTPEAPKAGGGPSRL